MSCLIGNNMQRLTSSVANQHGICQAHTHNTHEKWATLHTSSNIKSLTHFFHIPPLGRTSFPTSDNIKIEHMGPHKALRKVKFGVKEMGLIKGYVAKLPDFSIGICWAFWAKHNSLQISQSLKRNERESQNPWFKLCFCNQFAFVCIYWLRFFERVDRFRFVFWSVLVSSEPGTEWESKRDMFDIYTRCCFQAVCFSILVCWCPCAFISSDQMPVPSSEWLQHYQILRSGLKVERHYSNVLASVPASENCSPIWTSAGRIY